MTKRSPKLSEANGVNAADMWSERERSYLGRSRGHVEMNFKAWLKQDLPREVSRGHSTEPFHEWHGKD